MRRSLCGALILSFWLGPLAAILPANAESRLPVCCRRHGIHHCEMSGTMARQTPGSAPSLAAPAHCSYYPYSMPAAVGPIEALAASPVALPPLLATAHCPATARTAARLGELRTRANRGPPASKLG